MTITVEADLQIIVKGLSSEQGRAIEDKLTDILHILDREKGFDFRRLHRIIVTNDYAGELAALLTGRSSKNVATHTSEEYAQGVAQAIPLRLDDGFEVVLVFDDDFISPLTIERNDGGELPDTYRCIWHLVHHEFAHVHDYNQIIDALPLEVPQPTGKDAVLVPLASACRGEYMANYLSASTADFMSVSGMTESLTEAITRTKKEFDKNIIAFRWGRDADRLFSEFNRHGWFLVKAASYVLGYVDGLKTSLAELSADAAEALAGSYFEPTWDAMHKALTVIREEYPENLKNCEVLDPLVQALENYYDDMGLVLFTERGGKCGFDVPVRPETKISLTIGLFPICR